MATGYWLHRVLVSPFFCCLQNTAHAFAALCAVPYDAALATAVVSSADVPLDVSRVKVSIEYRLSEMMNFEALGILVDQVAPNVERWFPDLAELKAGVPAGTIDQSISKDGGTYYMIGHRLGLEVGVEFFFLENAVVVAI